MTLPTRGQNILDLFFTTYPTLVDNVSITPGLSDHDIVLTQVNVKHEVTKQVPRNIHLYKKADWDQLKQSMSATRLFNTFCWIVHFWKTLENLSSQI